LRQEQLKREKLEEEEALRRSLEEERQRQVRTPDTILGFLLVKSGNCPVNRFIQIIFKTRHPVYNFYFIFSIVFCLVE